MDYLRELAFPVASGYALFLWGLSVMIYRHRGALYLLCGGWLASCVVRSMSLSPELERLGYGLSIALCSWLAFRLLGDLRIRFGLLGGAALLFFPGTFYLGGAMLLIVGFSLMGIDIDEVQRRRTARLVGVLFESEGAYVIISYFSPLADVIPLAALIGSVGFLMYFLLSSDSMSPKARSVLNVGLLLFTLFTVAGAVTVKKMEDDFREGLLQESYRRLEMTKGKLAFFEMMGISMAKTVASDPLSLSALSSSGFGSDIQLRIINRRLGSSLVFITDVSGDVVATSDPSLRGHNFSFRGYFKQAMSGQNGLLYALGAVTDKVGAYFSRPLVDRQGQVLGVVVVKMDLDPVFGEVFQSESIFMRRGDQILMGPDGLRDCPLRYLSVSIPLPGVSWELVKLVPKRLIIRNGRILISFYLLFAAVALLALFRYVQKDQLIGELQREVADRQAAEDSERRARAEAEEANRAKSGFLANMSHEIRTPLNAVLGMAGLLLDTELDHRQGHYARIIQTSGESLLGLINDILDFSKIEADKMELESLDFDLQVLLEDVVEMLFHRAEEKGIGLSYAIDHDVPRFLRGDPVRIRQILVNLVGNGVKFTSQGEVKVKVSLYSSVGDAFNVRFSVVDTGIGIPSERVGVLFDAFEQVDSTTTRRFGGTGLGLAISRRLVELMGGRIGAKSVEGSGSDFWFNLPLPMALEDVREDRVPREILLGKKVLLVDDTSDNLLVLSERLGGWGMISEMCSSPTDSLRIVQGNPDRFDLVILDVQMPEMDGISLARSIRDVSSVPILFLSSIGDQPSADLIDSIERCLWLIKPARTSTLSKAVVSLISGSTVKDEGSSPRDRQLDKGRLLLVEDNRINQQVAMALLSKIGYSCDTASDGREGVEMWSSGSYSAILMDVQMPVMDGFEATAAIREIETKSGAHRIPIIAMTAHALSGYKEKCIAAGMDDYVTKPISPADLESVLAIHVKGVADDGAEAEEVPQEISGPSEGELPWRELPVFDQADGLVSVGDDLDFLMEMLALFYDTYGKKQGEIRDIADREDWEEGVAVAHMFKGAAGNLGLKRLSGCAAWVESTLKGQVSDGASDSSPMRELLYQLADEVEETSRFASERSRGGLV
ncbi:response regulator [Dethiosulfovibrio salsuginis]|uniref:Sensory/regulatory protein RpfC n=1 Tax=Dethiosulfovibrio salsuginis TaxID=561720 RepID=A0A1X7IS39_9BACT|nr:response regulator [Dethiosulfovibrio salsuginis]SMG17704.1 Signal transduction histidine kinase [Dethiosulfovibrio salsuginis]